MIKISMLVCCSLSLLFSSSDAYPETQGTQVLTHPEPSTYAKGKNLYHDKRYEEALVFFDRVLIEDEDDINAGIYYARILYLLGIEDEAKKSFESLKTKSLNAKQRAFVEKHLNLLSDAQTKHFFKTTLAIGVGYDDNINLTTDMATTQYGAITLNNDTNKKSSTFASATLSLAHRYTAKSFDIVTTFTSYNELLHTQKGNDLHYLNLSTGLSTHLGDWGLWLPLGANISYLDGEDVGHNLYISPMLSYHFSKKWMSSLRANYLDNTSTYMPAKDYTSFSSAWGLRYLSGDMMIGGELSFSDLSLKKSFRYDMDKKSLSPMLYGQFAIGDKHFVRANVAYMKDDYEYTDLVMGYAREDKVLQYGLTLGHRIDKKSHLQLAVSHIENDSNINAYSYKKNRYAFTYNYTF